MNYLSHLHLATAAGGTPAFGLGAMLPDLASMAGGRVGAAGDPTLAAGGRHHARVDLVFHAHPHFTRLQEEGIAALAGAGAESGPARAAAHVTVELLIDGVLIERDDGALAAAFRAALETGAPAAAGGTISWRRAEHAGSFERLRLFLLDHGLPHHYRRPAAVAERVAGILARRPRLALSEPAAAALGSWAAAIHAEVAAVTETILADVTRGCGGAGL